MSRSGFLRTAGLGAAALGAASMGMSNFAFAKSTPGKFRVGVMGIGPSLAGAPDYLERVGEATYVASEWALRKLGDHLGYDFEVIFADAGCGSGSTIDALMYLKSQRCDFIIGPNCSGSAREAVAVPGISTYPDGTVIIPDPSGALLSQYQDLWANTCVITPTADADINVTVANDNRTFFGGPFRYHVLGASAVNKSSVLGNLVCEQNKTNVSVIYEKDNPFVQSIADGIVQGYRSGCTGTITPVPFARDADPAITVANLKAAMGQNRTADAMVFASETNMAYEVSTAVTQSLYPIRNVYVSSEVGNVSGAQTASLVLDPLNTGTILGFTYDKCVSMSGVNVGAFNPFGSNVASLYIAQCFEAANILGELIIKHKGNVQMVNLDLTAGIYPTDRKSTGLFRGVSWDGTNVFPNYTGGIKAEAKVIL